MIQAAIQILTNDNSFKTAIGTNQAGSKYKVYPVRADQGEKPPYAVLFISSMDPISNCDDQFNFEVIIYSEPSTIGAYIKADTLSGLARDALEAHSGQEANTAYTLNFKCVNIRDGFDSEVNLVQRILTFTSTVER